MPVKTNTISRIKKELELYPREVLIEHCLRMARYKKENKELLNYILFEADDEETYVDEIKKDIAAAFAEVNQVTFYYAKKNIRRIHRLTTKHIKYSGLKTTEIELLIFYCRQMQTCGISFNESKVMQNMYQRQIKNIEKAMASLHEDIRLDYEDELGKIKKGL
jgi:hypothetical protein